MNCLRTSSGHPLDIVWINLYLLAVLVSTFSRRHPDILQTSFVLVFIKKSYADVVVVFPQSQFHCVNGFPDIIYPHNSALGLNHCDFCSC